ncbi:hypothetical protein EDC94DRAFT_620087 [Helicostylum pulchrum]|nr:hypothetical protein EDC94DRAFT_620087 [Helicostylum pulchrum]
MESKKFSSQVNNNNTESQVQPVEQIPNRSSSNRLVSSHLIPPVTTNRTHKDTSGDELNKNIGSDYQEIQIRTLTKWINVQLSQVDEHISSIDKDLKNGKKLLKLLAVVSKNPLLKPERGSMRIHELSNVAQALKFLQDQWGADSLPAIASEAIVNGDVKSTLAITFFIMLKYQIHPILLNNPDFNAKKDPDFNTNKDNLKVPPPSPLPSVSASRSGGKPMAEAKLALLYWVRSQLQDYIQNHIITTIQDFSRSWRSGLAFCLLIHRHDPDLVPTLFTEHIEHASEKETWNTLLSLAFEIAEQHLNVPQYLEPADLTEVDYPHEPSVMMYVSEMYKVMSLKDSKIDKRLRDISLIKPESQDDITPPDSNSPDEDDDEEDDEEEEEEDELPSTPQPELLITTDDVYQQLDTLSFLLSPNEEKEVEQQLKDNQKSRLLLDQAQQIINKLDPSSSEKQVLYSRYNQLKSEWELLSQRLQVIQHTSNYTNQNDNPAVQNQLNACKISIHPLDGTADIIDPIERSVSAASSLFDNGSNQELKLEFDHDLNQLQLYKRGITFSQITSALNYELDVIQQLMSNSGVNKSVVTDDLIQSLEQRIHVVNTSIQGVRDEFNLDLLRYDTGDVYFDRFVNLLDDIEDRYETVRDWVDQVRVWFVEAERIRAWIDKQILIIEERNESDTFNPISRDITIADSMVIHVHEEHQKLKQEIDHFDSDDMNRLRAHVKMLTQTASTEDIFSSDRQDLTPADTSTIEITLTTLTMLNQLTHLLTKRSQLIDLLLLRVKWEDLFGTAVQWIAKTDGELDGFLRGKARWSEKEESSYESSDDDEQGIESVIKTLVSLERKIADFDHGDYSNVLDAYQEMETLENEVLPDYLEVRQLGFEKAFEDLMKRSGFSRKVVEQLLSMINTVSKFKELRDVGERLRYHLLQDTEDKIMQDEDVYTEQVQLFKEESARLITNAETSIPYPSVPEMSTAIGANDSVDNQITNENIKSTISAYSMSLALIADGLDQLLMSRYQIMSLQQRTQEAYGAMTRVRSWMEERIKLLAKSRFDLMLYTDQKQSLSSSSSCSDETKPKTSSNNANATTLSAHTAANAVADEDNLLRLEKERDGIASRLEQMENDELTKLFETVRVLEYDVDASNAVSIDRDHLVNGVESLEKTHQQLKALLLDRGLQLDVLKKRIDWETQWSKSNSHLHTIGRKLCDFNVKKARYDPAKENVDKPSYTHDNENMQSFQFIQDRVAELGDRHIISLSECYQDMVDSYALLGQSVTVPEFISTKQSDLKSEYDDLRLLSSYTLDLMTQRSTITEFLLRSQDAHHEGDKIKDAISKKTRRIMVKEEEGAAGTLDDHVKSFKQEVKSIWQECGKNMVYPVYNGNWLRSSGHPSSNIALLSDANSAGLYRSQVRAQIKALLDKKMDELAALEKSIDQLLQVYRDADLMKALVTQYEQEACQLGGWINQQIEALKQQHVDVSAESFLARGINISDLKKSRLDLFLQVESFESNKVKVLHDQIAQLVQDSVEKKKNQSVDVSAAARNLGEVMDHLSQLKRGLSDQAVTLEAASMRSQWESSLQLGISRLEEMNEQLRQFTTKKNQWISQDDLSEEHVQILQQDLNRLVSQRNKFEKSILPGIQSNYDAFVEFFPKLARPVATPDHLEARMESLGRTSLRFQESVAARSKELELIKQRIAWEDTVKQALRLLADNENKIEAFIEEKARWQNNNSMEEFVEMHDEEDESNLRTELSGFYNDFQSYQEDVILPLQKRFDALVNDSSDHYNGSSVALLPNAFMKKMQDVVSAQDRNSYYLDFSNQVVSQRCLVAAFILRTAQLEQSAELIREEFIATKANGTAHIAGLLQDHTDRLQKFKAGIEDVRQNLATSIPFPVRSLQNISTQAKLKDETTNSVIHETIEIRNTRLDEICSALQQLLESKERVSRRRLSLHSYKKQAQAAEAWIDSRHEILTRSNSIIVKKENAVDMEKLKEAVSQADSVGQAMKSTENVFTSLNNTFDKCITAFQDKSLDQEEVQDDAHHELVKEVEDIVEPTQKRLSQAWNTLLIEAAETAKNTTALLIENKIQSWLGCLNNLLRRVMTDDSNDDLLSEWVDELEQLENREYQNLMVDVEANKGLLNQEQFDKIDLLFKNGSNIMRQIGDRITELQNDLHLGQLIEKYLNDISSLQSLIQVQIDQLNKTNQEHVKIDGEASVEDRNGRHQDLVVEYKQASDQITDLKDVHGDVLSQYDTILASDESFKDNYQQDVFSKWQALMSLESMVSALVSRSSKWVKYFNSLTSICYDLETVKSKLGSTLSEEEKDTEYKQLDEKLNQIDSLLKGELFNLLDELIQDNVNFKPFESQRYDCLQLKNLLKAELNQQMTVRERHLLVLAVKSVIDRLCDECNTQLELANKHCSAVVFGEDVQNTVEACSQITSANGSVYSHIQNEIDALRLNQCNELVTKLNCKDDEINTLIEPLTAVLTQLDKTTRSEKECLSLANLVSQYMISQDSLLSNIESYLARASIKDIKEDVLFYLEGRLESLDENKKEVNSMAQSIIKFKFKYLMECKIRMANVSAKVERSQKMIDNKYDAFMVFLQNSRVVIEKVKRRQLIVAKLNDLIVFIADMSDRVNALQLTGDHDSSSEELEFKELCQDFYQTLDKKKKSTDGLLKDYEGADTDEEIKLLRERLSADTDALSILINIKKKQASDEGDLTEFLAIMSEFDEQIVIVLAAIENASPHHSGIVNNKFVKADLQALLRSLVVAYKQHQITINATLDRAVTESKKQFLGNNERVATAIQKAAKKWAQVQAAAAARERELQTCVGKLDHEFFTKLAMAKTTPKRSRHVLPPQPALVKRHSAASNGRYFNTVSPFPRRSVDESSRKSSKTPTSASSSASRLSRPSYVPDPRNALDIELSNIVNASPYRITVKIVPDQVGKYWFGDENPRLVYCRILPSQLVMVRVGGGWVELSKFLRDHGLTEGVSSRPSSSNENNVHQEMQPFQEGYLQTFRASSPTGRVTIRGGGGAGNSSSLASTRSSSKSSGRSKSPLPGFVDGDKYISVDEAGNHVVVKMKKANSDAKMPTIKKKQ